MEHTTQNSKPLITALLIALPLSILGGAMAWMVSGEAGHGVVATGIGLVIGMIIFGASSRLGGGSLRDRE